MNELEKTTETAKYLKMSPRTLEGKRLRGDGPPFVKVSANHVLYRKADVDRWLSERIKNATCEG